ncbi:MAG: type II secretion system protein GspL [Gammaproteobacteria bacterium]
MRSSTDADGTETVALRDAGRWRSCDWPAVAAAAAGQRLVVLLDGAEVTLLDVELPVSDLATARRAAPFAVEEALALPLDETALAIAPRGGKRFALAACRAERVAALRAAVETHGLRPELVAPEPYALPVAERSFSVWLDDDTALLRWGRSHGMKVPREALAAVVEQLRQEYPETERVRLFAADAVAAEDHAFDGLELAREAPPDGAAIAAAVAAAAPPLMFDASHGADARARAARWWRLTGVAALLALIAYPVLLWQATALLDKRERALSAANLATFRAAFPDVNRVVNARVQAEQALTALRARAVATPAFLDLLSDFQQAYAVGADARTAVRTISFSGGVLEISVETADMAELERVRTALGAAGLGAEMLSAESTDSGVVARLRVREAS